uniref:Sulfotransfer_1 domain-containing protein n=1 Tax=Caenorhabditis tropicalis TaxID=1561998 RepID=A0A1I7TCX3_9PELO
MKYRLLLILHLIDVILCGVIPNTAKKRFPDAIIIGVKKSGTRALLEFLRINPLIKAPGPEVHFFDKNFNKGLEWYRSVDSLLSY